MKTFNELIDLSIKGKKSKGYEVNFSITVNGETWRAYEASVCNRDILLYCDQGTATYLVDSYGDKNVAELFDWNKE